MMPGSPKITWFKRWWPKVLLFLRIRKHDQVYGKTQEFVKKLRQFSKNELIMRIIYLRSQLYGTPEIMSIKSHERYRGLPKRRLINIVVAMCAAIQTGGSK